MSFAELAGILERDHPVELRYPFEGSEHVGGAAWLGSELLGKTETAGVAKLHWKAGANDLPMHTHETSDRLIVVLEGRGFFHCCITQRARRRGRGIDDDAELDELPKQLLMLLLLVSLPQMRLLLLLQWECAI